MLCCFRRVDERTERTRNAMSGGLGKDEQWMLDERVVKADQMKGRNERERLSSQEDEKKRRSIREERKESEYRRNQEIRKGNRKRQRVMEKIDWLRREKEQECKRLYKKRKERCSKFVRRDKKNR